MRYSFLVRWKYRFLVFMAGDVYTDCMFSVGTDLFSMSRGKLPLPDAAKCRELSDRLLIKPEEDIRKRPWWRRL